MLWWDLQACKAYCAWGALQLEVPVVFFFIKSSHPFIILSLTYNRGGLR